MTSILQIEDARVWFGGVKAVDGVSLTLQRGRLTALVGPNGSGKSTLINAITRVVDLTAGELQFEGERITKAATYSMARRGLSRTFQGIRLVEGLNVRENVALGLESAKPSFRMIGKGSSTGEVEAIQSVLERFNLVDVAHLQAGSLPYGVQRRVEMARALVSNPRLLLLDEPVAGMNAEERLEISEILLALKEDGLTILLVEHDLQFVLNLSDHMYVLNFGSVVAEGEPKVTAALPVVQEVFLGRRQNHVGA